MGMIETTLHQLGLSHKDIVVYLTVLKHGKILPAEVAKRTNLNRSTVYSVASELKKRGLLTEDLGGSVRYLVALPPEDLMNLATKQEIELKKKTNLIQEAIAELHSFTKAAVYTPPKITFITQEEVPIYLRKQTPKWNESILKIDKTWWGFQDHTFVDSYGDWVDWYWTSAVPKDLRLITLSNRSETEKEMKKKGFKQREIYFWKESNAFTATMWVCGDYLVMISTRQEPHYLVEIHDPLLAQNMRELFKGILKTMK